jgi:ABC-type uncharacterized transport system ATPase subunit
MIFIRQKPLIYLFLIFNFFILKNSFALDSLSYSGRLVQTNGSPVTGPVNLRAELVYTNNLTAILCSDDISSVSLSKGVFHIKLDFVCSGGKTLTQVLAQAPANESVAIQISDVTNSKSYSFQAIHAIPYANVASVASQLEQMGAGDGEFLKWDNTAKQWKPGSVSGATGGTVTSVSASGPLTVTTPTSTPAISISQANTTTSGYLTSADWNTFNSKEGAIAGGTVAKFYRGDKSWQTLDTSVVPENVNLYFTNARSLGVPLTGFVTAAGAIVATDTTLTAFGKTQGQINAINTASANYLIKNSTDAISGLVNVGTTGLLQLNYVPVGMSDAVNKSYTDTKLALTGGTLTGVLTLDDDLKIKGGSNYVTVKGHATSANYNLTLPQTAGTAGYVLSTDGAGTTTWVTPAVGSSNITDGSIVNADVNAAAAIDQSKIANLTTDLAAKEPAISAGTTAQYWKGNKTWASLQTDVQALVLSGFATGSNATLANTDSISGAFGKVQGQINALNSAAANYLIKNSTDTVTGVVNVGATGLLQLGYVPLGLNDATNKSYVDSEVGAKVSKTGDTMSGVLTLDNDLKIKGGTNYVTVKGHAASANYNLTLPQTAGTAGYVLSTDGAGATTWITPAVGSSNITDGSIVNADVNAGAAIDQSKIANLTTDLAAKEPTISAGTTAQYWKGNKTWASLQTDVQALVLNGFTTGANATIANTDTVSGAFGKVQGQIDAINTSIVGKEASLAVGSNSQFYRGDKTWQTLNGGAVANTPVGNIAATTTQNAINELDSEKQDKLTVTSVIDNRELRFYELPGNGTFYSSLKSPDDLTANINYTLPLVAPTLGQVLSSNASGVMSWISIPSAPVTTVFGRNGVVAATAGDYTASQITNTPAGTIAATDVQTALNELATEKEAVLTNPSDTTKYYRGDKTWSTFSTDAINSVLSSFAIGAGTKPAVTNTDTIVGAFGKVQKNLNDIDSDYVSKSANNNVTGSFNISGITSFIQVPTPSGAVVNEAANVQYVQNYVGGFGQWSKTGSDIYRSSGNVGIGTSSPMVSSLLELSSTSKGFSPPRMTLAQRNAIASPTQGLIVFNTTDNTLDYYNGSAWLALNGSPKYIKLSMSAYQSVANGSIVNFDSVSTNSGMARSGNGIQLKAGVTYRLESAINTISATGLNYLGYVFFNGTTSFGNTSYTDEGENGTYGFKASLLEIYKPSVDEVVSVKIVDANIGTGQISNNYNTYLIATELVPAGPAGGGSDNLGNHTLGQNLITGSNWISGDGGAEGIRIDSSGNVGVGTTTPLGKLHVAGTTVQEGNTSFAYSGTVGTAWIGATSNVWGQPYLHIGGETSGGVRRLGLFADQTYFSGNVGIGTTSPSAHLEVSSATGSPVLKVGAVVANQSAQLNLNSGAAGYPHILFTQAGTGRFEIGQVASNGNFYFNNNTQTGEANAAMVISKTGNIGIGTNSPSEKLDVVGTAAVDYLRVDPQSGPNEGGEIQLVGAGSNGTIQIDNMSGNLRIHTLAAGKIFQVIGGGMTVDGNVGIGTLAPGYKLDVNGTIRGFGITDSSDIRLKEEIIPLKNDLEKINKLQGVSYFWKDREKSGDKKQIGLIAQAVEKIYPEFVETDKAGMKSVNYSHIVAPLIEAVKSLYNKVLGLDEKLALQERKISSKADKTETDSKILKLESENAKLKKENESIKARLDKIEKALNRKQ